MVEAKKSEKVIYLLKNHKKIFLVSKGCFWCKTMQGIQKSWSQCSTILTFWEIRSFLKKWLAEICGKKQQNHIFQKSPNFAKIKHCRALGPAFLGFSLHFTSKTLNIDLKKICFQFFHSKGTFLPLLSQQPWLILWIFAPSQKN